MRVPFRARQVTALILVVLIGATLRAQDLADVRVQSVRTVGPGAVEVLATVTDARGRRIDGLSAANFYATVGQQRTDARSVEPTAEGGPPLSIILLLDTSGSMGRSFKSVKEAASAFIEQLSPDDSCSLMTFGYGVRTIANFGSDKGRLLALLNAVEARESKTYLYQAIDDALNRAVVAPSARNAVVLLTDGRDEGSAITADDVVRRIDQTRIPVYTLAFGGDADSGLLRRISALSHGASFEAPTGNELKATYLAILDQLKTAYRVSFAVGGVATGLQQIELTVSLRSKTVAARFEHSFLSEPPSDSRSSSGGRHALFWVAISSLIAIVGLVSWVSLRRRTVTSTDSDLAKTVVPPRVWLDVVNGVHAGEKLLLFGDSSTIGRDSKTCQACLARDPLVGRVHARVFKGGGSQYLLEDLGSQNGTRLNDLAIREPVALQTGDRISVGMSQLVFNDNR